LLLCSFKNCTLSISKTKICYNHIHMNRILKRILWGKRRAEPLVTVRISQKNILHNLAEFQKLSGSIAPVLKSNAYGHGLVEVANILENASVPFFVVDSYYEAHTLRYNNIKKSLLVIGYTLTKTIDDNIFKDISFVVTSLSMLKEISELKKDIYIHLKIDTGMHRQGIMPEELGEALRVLSECPNIKMEGAMTHFSDADGEDFSYTEKQIVIWNSCATKIKEVFPEISFLHISNTAGHVFINKTQCNLSRLGIGLYGLPSGGEIASHVNLKPALSMETIIVGLKKISAGSHVGYSKTFTATKDMRIAVIPLGYFEGVDRRLSNKGYVKIGEKYAKIIGRVSMNITTIDVTAIPEAGIGTKVHVVSNIPDDKNSIENLAKLCNTISYDEVVHIPEHLRRVVI